MYCLNITCWLALIWFTSKFDISDFHLLNTDASCCVNNSIWSSCCFALVSLILNWTHQLIFSGPLPFSTTLCPTSLTTVAATSSSTETTTLPPRRPTTSVLLIPSLWKPRTRWGTDPSVCDPYTPPNCWLAELTCSGPSGGLHEVPAGELGLLPPSLRQGGQRLQHGNFYSGEGQDQIHAVQSPCCVRTW